jgi:cobalt/nickel transport system permease protein
MHMADALISPGVGGTMWVAAAGLIGACSRVVRRELDERRVPLMAVVGAFVFAAQMINFTIPGTGSSGHIGGGLLLSILLGPHAAFLTLASVLTIQALFFGDGGILALGCNIVNLGLFPCFIAYPLIYRRFVGRASSSLRTTVGAVAASVVGLELGASGVVLETWLSGASALPLGGFVLAMLPIHLAIGVVEGLATAAVVVFARGADLPLHDPGRTGAVSVPTLRKVIVGFAVATVVVGVGLSWFASTHPDGLEWSLLRSTGSEELAAPAEGPHASLARLQEKTALLPDYGFRGQESNDAVEGAQQEDAWPAVDAGTSVAGLVGALLTVAVLVLAGFVLRRRHAGAAA